MRLARRGASPNGRQRPVATRRLLTAVLVGAALASGCGSSGSKTSSLPLPAGLRGNESGPQSPAPGAEQNADRSSIAVSTPARTSDGVFASRYTCKGADISPPIKWAGVNASAKEVLITVRMIIGPLLGANTRSVAWSMANISPSIDHVEAGEVPPGAVVARNSSGKIGYSLCPPSNARVVLVTVAVDAFPRKLGLHQGYEPVAAIRKAFEIKGAQWGSVLSNVLPHS